MSTAPQKLKFLVEIVGDVICPFCFIGSRNLQSGIELYRSSLTSEENHCTRIEICHIPYFLNPDIQIPAEPPINFDTDTLTMLRAQGQSCEPPINFEAIGGTMYPSIDALCLSHIAAKQEEGGVNDGLQQRIMESLYCSFFEEGANIGDLSLLRGIGLDQGLPEAGLSALGSEDLRQEVQRLEGDKRFLHRATGSPLFQLKLKGVPLPTGKVKLQGVQPPSIFPRAFDHLKVLLEQQ
jgi:predicted DsbA family dithiol-disulfide isomerase